MFIYLCFFSFTTWASGLFHLTEFPQQEFYLEMGGGIKYTELSSNRELGKVNFEQEPAVKLLVKGGYLYERKHLFTVEADYILTEASESRKGENPVYFEYNNGFQEPYFEYRYRHRAPSEKDNFLDFFFGVRPSVMDRKIGRNGLDTWIGRSVANIGIYHGSEVPGSKWEFQTFIQGTRYFAGKEENVRDGVTRKFEPTHEFRARLSTSYLFLPNTMIYGGVGLTIFGDTNLKSRGEDLTLQRGTASNIDLGLKHLVRGYVFDLSARRIRHDYFVKADTFSFDGDVESWEIHFTTKKEF